MLFDGDGNVDAFVLPLANVVLTTYCYVSLSSTDTITRKLSYVCLSMDSMQFA